MNDSTVIHSTFVLERTYPAPPERVFAAFSDPALKRRWFVEGPTHDVEKYQLDFRAGGKETALLRFKEGTPIAGMACTNDTTYLVILPTHRIAFANTMTLNGHCISASLVTVELLSSEQGTALTLTHQAAFFEGSDGPQRREDGWRLLLDRLSGELTA